MAKTEWQGSLDIASDRPAPTGQAQRSEGTGVGQRDLGLDVRDLMEQERETDLGLRHPEAPQVEVDHRLAELAQPGPGCLNTVAVGDVEEMDPWHACHVDTVALVRQC
jgi:hypothetical protein